MVKRMPKLKPETHSARRTVILNAAEQCFAKSGFHAASVQDICKAANISSGSLYIYFSSKEALIEGICERNRREFAERFSSLAEAPDLLDALKKMGELYLLDEPVHKRKLCIEIGAEATRTPAVSEMFRRIDNEVTESFMALFERQRAAGRIAPKIEIKKLTAIFKLLGDGLFWRRALEPDFNTQATIDIVIELIGNLMNPTPSTPPRTNKESTEALS